MMILVPILVFAPFAAGLASYVIGAKDELKRDRFACVISFVFLAAALGLFAIVLNGQGAKAGLAIMNPEEHADRSFGIGRVLGFGLHFTPDGFRAVYALIAAFMWAVTALFSMDYFREERRALNRYWFFMIVTLGATEGVMLSADLLTTFVFFEILSFTSFTWVIHEETEEARRAGYTYLFIAVIGGLVLFMGMLLLYTAAGTLNFTELAELTRKGGFAGGAGVAADAEAAAVSIGSSAVFGSAEAMVKAAGICILLGFGAKAGMYPLHIWLPKAHPIAPSPASALLSGILTKVGIYGILMTALSVFAYDAGFGTTVLILGLITMVLGAVLALCSVNLKRTLACSSMSQIGFILTGVGMSCILGAAGEEEGVVLSVCGLMLHMVNHSLIKLTLFTAAGVVMMNAHALELNEIRGFGRKKTFLKIAFALGALGISGVPLLNGYISKTLLHEGIVEGIHAYAGYAILPAAGLLKAAEWIFLISGGLTFAYMLKLFLCIFVEENADAARQAAYDRGEGFGKQGMTSAGIAAVFGSSLLLPVLGQPFVMTRLAGFMSGFEEIYSFRAFSLTNLKGGAISLLIGGLVYLVVVRRVLMRNGSYVNIRPERLDLENLLYRPLLTKGLPALGGFLASLFAENVLLKPLARFAVGLGTFAGRVLESSTDACVVLLRKTVMREKRVAGEKREHPGLLRTLAEETGEAARPLTQNFTFALLMTCIGIVSVLTLIVYYALIR